LLPDQAGIKRGGKKKAKPNLIFLQHRFLHFIRELRRILRNLDKAVAKKWTKTSRRLQRRSLGEPGGPLAAAEG